MFLIIYIINVIISKTNHSTASQIYFQVSKYNNNNLGEHFKTDGINEAVQ